MRLRPKQAPTRFSRNPAVEADSLAAEKGAHHPAAERPTEVGRVGVAIEEGCGGNERGVRWIEEHEISVRSRRQGALARSEAETVGNLDGGQSSDEVGREPEVEEQDEQVLTAGDASPDLEKVRVRLHRARRWRVIRADSRDVARADSGEQRLAFALTA